MKAMKLFWVGQRLGFKANPLSHWNDFCGRTSDRNIIVMMKYIMTSMICSQAGTSLISQVGLIDSIGRTLTMHSSGL